MDALGRGEVCPTPRPRPYTFGVGISTVKRYAAKARRGEPLEPGKAPGKPPKMDERVGKRLQEDLEESTLSSPPFGSAATAWKP